MLSIRLQAQTQDWRRFFRQANAAAAVQQMSAMSREIEEALKAYKV